MPLLTRLSFVAAVCLAGGVVAQPAAKVVLDSARIERIENRRRVTGELRAVQRSHLAAREEGLVLELSARPGDTIKQGQVITRLDDDRARLEVTTSEARVAALQATVAERQAAVDRARVEFERVDSLREQASASTQELEDAQLAVTAAAARLNRAQADVAAAEAELALDRQRLDDMLIRALFDAKVIALHTEVGQWLSRGSEVVEIYATDAIEAWVDVPETAVKFIQSSGGTVRVHVPAFDEDFVGTITQIVPAADPLSRLFPVRIAMPDPEQRLRPGMSVTAFIPIGTVQDMLTISKDAILRDDAGEYVFMAVPNERAPEPGGMMGVPVRITRIFGVGDRVAIRPGSLPPGAALVVEGNERMYPTQPLIDVGAKTEPSERANDG